jgi:osmotically-inducible protein OsmY
MATINKTIPKININSDKRLMNEIWDRLQKIDTIRSLDQNSISIEVDNGEVLLIGHLVNDGHKQRIESIIENIPGATLVKNKLVGDRTLASMVAQALTKDTRTRPFFIYVSAFHGWVHLSGKVTLAKDQAVVEEVAASVPEVRGVVALPHLVNGKIADKHHVVQPSIYARVYDRANSLGRVYRVVIDPHNRLVTGAIVEAAIQVNRRKEKGYFFITSNFMRVVNERSVIIDDSLPDITSSPLFNQVEFLVPPEDWSPPYPYKTGEILWPKGVSNV